MYVAETNSGEWFTVEADGPPHPIIVRITEDEGKGRTVGLFRFSDFEARDLVRAIQEKLGE